MFIYNVTIKADPSINDAWVAWMKEKHIPEVMAKGCFTGHRFAKLLEIDEEDGSTYTIQYFIESREQYERYIAMFATALRQDLVTTWGSKVIAFRSLMQLVN